MHMNYKLEKFWNPVKFCIKTLNVSMNYKLEKFWNSKNMSDKQKEIDEL